jgi:hypothetical protein
MIALGLATHYSMSEVRYSFTNNMFLSSGLSTLVYN